VIAHIIVVAVEPAKVQGPVPTAIHVWDPGTRARLLTANQSHMQNGFWSVRPVRTPAGRHLGKDAAQ
jgi:hypothetical protein